MPIEKGESLIVGSPPFLSNKHLLYFLTGFTFSAKKPCSLWSFLQ